MLSFSLYSSISSYVHQCKGTVDDLSNYVNIYALAISITGVFLSTRKLVTLWKTRHLRRIWGIKNGEEVIVVCSELDDPAIRQNVEPREFIYNLKYGDIDALFEVVVTLLKLYPDIRLRVMSSGEVESTRINLGRHLVLIGGPDYNNVTSRIISKNLSRYAYRSPFVATRSIAAPNEIVIHDTIDDVEYYETTDEKDFGYFERIVNPNNPQNSVILIGGCHTIGVTGAVKALSLAESEDGDISTLVLNNAKEVAKTIKRSKSYSVLVSSERVGQTISIPIVDGGNIKTL